LTHGMHAGNVLQYTQLASVLMGAGQLGEAEALLNQLLLHVETVKVRALSILLDVGATAMCVVRENRDRPASALSGTGGHSYI